MSRQNTSTDFATLFGLIAGLSVVVIAMIAMAGLSNYINLPGLLIVVGGTAAAVMIKFPLRSSFTAFKQGLGIAFRHGYECPQDLIRTAAQLAMVSRNKGALALESVPTENPFFKKGAQLIADGHNQKFIHKSLSTEIDLSIEKLQLGERVFRAIGDSAPAFGMIGTLVGLVQMLANMDDPRSIGIGMAVALLTTLYGALIAHLFANPIADKLQMHIIQQYNNKNLILESFVQIFDRQSPRVVEDMLDPYLKPQLFDAPVIRRERSRGRRRSEDHELY